MRSAERRVLVALVTAGLLASGPSLAVDRPPVVIGCEGVAEFIAGWLVAGEPLTRLVVKGAVTSLVSEADHAHTTLCEPHGPRVVCIEQSAAGLAVGDAVTLEGMVGHADAAGIVLDPCGAILRK